MDLRDQLQSTLGTSYTLERELGGGGMSRVFLANENALGRKVVVKVLPPEMTQGVSVERFKREIQLAAQLQHPHIVPVHASGETGGLPFYTMPFVDGASLRSRISKAGALPIGEVVSILREVAKALAYAHERGVVHRDIKPDNVLITGGSAVVTDFGIAKALSASRMQAPDGTLTQLGTSIGTPAYMAPEQAAGDPNVDARADLYSFGCMAYELLAGKPPFHGRTPQRMLAAHMGEKPQPIAEVRPDTPPLLAELVMRCLEKEPDDRPQSARDLVKVLESVATSGGAHPAMPEILLGGRPRLGRALLVYAAAFVAVAVVAKAAIVAIGLPTWVFPGALIVMALGLPAILVTAFVHHGAREAMTMAQLTPGGSTAGQGTIARIAVKASPWITWRRTTLAGAATFGVFLLLVAGYMVTRALGIGPAASLMSAGVLGAREKLIIADFKSPASDTTLGPVVTEAFRSDLAQSSSVQIMQPTALREVLRLMQRPTDARIDYALAREIATREGVKAVMDGEVLGLGGGFVIAARLMSAQTGDVLADFRVTANQPKDIIPAIDELSRDVRTKVGESLKRINAAPPLQQVTTPSLPALRKYVQAVQMLDGGSSFTRGIALLEEAIALDTGFAMAYRKLAVELGNRPGYAEREIDAIEKAYAHRDRLSEPERYLTEAAYWSNGPNPDEEKALAAYEGLIELQPNNPVALNNASVTYQRSSRNFQKAEAYAKRAIAIDSGVVPYYDNAIGSEIALGKLDEADRMAALAVRHLPAPLSGIWHGELAEVRDQFDSAEAVFGHIHDAANDDQLRNDAAQLAYSASLSAGRLARAERWRHGQATAAAAVGVATARLDEAIDRAMIVGWFRDDPPRALAILDSALRAEPLQKFPPIGRPYAELAHVYALAGRADRAKEMLAGFNESRKAQRRWTDEYARHATAGEIALAEHSYDTAIREFRSVETKCPACVLPDLGRAYDLSGNADSAIAAFSRFAEQHRITYTYMPVLAAEYSAGVYKRLGELYEAKGDREKAATYYTKFLEQWKNADPELQPKVAEVRKRLARLGDTEPKR
jgi:tetratricopeptide (TPR) repeat protein/tRNA A-37 threonylcarbamoyl transferase component Bud32